MSVVLHLCLVAFNAVLYHQKPGRFLAFLLGPQVWIAVAAVLHKVLT